MNASEVRKIAKTGKAGKHSAGDNLYLRISDEGTAFWVFRYVIYGKRRQLTLGRYGERHGQLSLADARVLGAKTKALVKQGIDPIAEKKRPGQIEFRTVSDLAAEWLKEKARSVKHPQIPERIYRKEIAPHIGEMALDRVKPMDIRHLCLKVTDSGRPAVANDTLSACKQLFRFGLRLGLIEYSPAESLKIQDAGGVEKSRKRALTLDELKVVFQVFREHSAAFTRENYLAVALLLCLGVRKTELTAAPWSEFDLEKCVWHLPAERAKTGVAISIPLAPPVMEWLNELRVRAGRSEYVFPARRASKRRGYISDDTINHALTKLFGEKVDGKKVPCPNVLGQAGIEYFTVHDLRRTCRSLLSPITSPHVAERCVNHKLKGVEAIYDRYDYFEERRAAQAKLANKVSRCIEA